MRCRLFLAGVLAGLLLGAVPARGEQPADSTPKPIPQTRPEMKRVIENLKTREPRLPLRALTAEEQAGHGNRPVVNNGRARALYLPKEWQTSNFQPDPLMSLDDTFKVRLFWIVSRGNNCQYCLGHQELKLRSAGMLEDQIAALDSEWEAFPADERPAMEFARRLTLAPHALQAAELDALRARYNNLQWIELVQTVSSFNSTNRWTDSLGLPQDQQFRDQPTRLDTETSERFRDRPTTIFSAVELRRPPLERRADVEAALSAARQRTPRVELLGEDQARALLPADFPAGPLPQWVRALAWFTKTGVNQIAMLRAVENVGRLNPRVKAKLAWAAARQDRAWYAVGHAQQRLAKLGLSADEIYALDDDQAGGTAAEREAIAFAKKLTANSRDITDDDIARLRKVLSDHEVAEVVQVVCVANLFDRLTEVLNLRLEGE